MKFQIKCSFCLFFLCVTAQLAGARGVVMCTVGFAATGTSILGLNNDRIFESSETMRVEESLVDTTATSVAIKDIEFTMTLDPSSASEDAGTDFTAPSGHVEEISDGLTEGTFDLEIDIIEDTVPEGDETVVISVLIDPMGPDNVVTIEENFTITDNDGPAPTFNTPRNVVLLLIDDLGWADTGVYGSSFHDTPHIDRLAAQGARFTQFYAASPVCSPTRASLMTGKHPARLHLTNWIGGEQQGALLQAPYERTLHTDETTIGEAFQQAGYATAYIGKWHLGQRTGQGFDYMRAVNDAGQPGSYFPPYKDNSFPHSNVPNLEGDGDDAYLTDRLTDLAVTFLETSQTQPFFLVLSHYAVHTPIESRKAITRTYEAKAAALPALGAPAFLPEGILGRTKQRQDHPVYAGMIKSVDESVGRILELLDRLDLADNTVVVFVSDNGGLSTLQGDRNSAPTSNLPLRAGKGLLYEGGIRIPMIIRDPGNISGGQVIDTPAMTTDLYPTMLSLTNLPLRTEQHTDGMDLSPLLTGKTTTLPQRMLYWHFPHYHGSGNRPTGAIRDGAYKMIEWFEDGHTELFHLEDDMGEAADLADDMPDKTRELQQALHRWREAVDARMPTSMVSSITLSVSPSSVAENAARSVTVTARVGGRARFPQAQMVTASVGKSGDSAVEGTDYIAVDDLTITIAAYAAWGTGTFMLSPMNNSIYEGNKTISVEGNVAGTTITVTPATITITDNDVTSTALVLTLDPNSTKEDAGTVDVEVEVSLNGIPRTTPTPITISITDGTADSADYSVSEPTVTLEIAAGMTEVTERVEFDIANDNVTEDDETVTLEASATGTNLASDSADFTIEDDDVTSTALVLTLDPNSAEEDAGTVDVEVEVRLDADARPMSIPVAISITDGTAGSADYSVSRSTVTLEIAAGMTEVTERVEFDIANDNVTEEDETVVIEASATGTNLVSDSKNFTIEDDDVVSTALVLTLDPARLHEDSGTSWVRFTAGLDGATRTMDTPVEVRVTAGTATEDADYRTPVVPASLVISSGETSLSDSLQMVITDNDTMEGNKTVVIEVSATGTNLDSAREELTIVDDESGVRVDTLMAEVNATGGYTITTPVRQNMGAPVTSVVLHYGDGMTFEMAPMEMSSEGSYTAELMAPEEGGILYYYVLATNEDGLTATYPPEGRYLDISDYTGGSRLVLLDFEDGDAGDKSDVGHAVVYRGGEGAFAEDALVLDGMDDHAEILGSSLGASEEFALEIMFNADDFDAAVLDAGGTYLVSKPARCAACWEESTFSLLWERSADSGTLLAARFWNPEYGESGQVELEIPMPLVARQWYHAVLEVQRRDAGQRAVLRLRDQSGMLHGEDVAVLPAHPAISTYPIFVGHIGDRGFFDGRIDDVAFYNYAHFGLSLASSEDTWEVPEGYVLEQNYPNPFNPVTTIRYDLAKVGHVRLEVSDLLGRRVALLVDAVQEAGAQEVRFDARDLPSGMYLYRLRVEDFVSVKKMVLLK